MNKHSELSWLPLSDRKNIDLPNILWEEYTGQEYGGYYEHGSTNLVIVMRDERTVDSTIAHEFKHYLQYINGNSSINGSDLTVFSKYDYNTAITIYFKTQPHELDALLYEHKIARNYWNDFWLRGLINNKRIQ